MALDFEQVKSTAKKKIAEKSKNTTDIPLTEQDYRNIDTYIGDLEDCILEYAEEGELKITYDCSKLKRHIFFEFANEFKRRNPLFFVVTYGGEQRLVVEWSGKNEV